MVVFSVKGADGDGFLFESTTETENDDLIASIVAIHNGRIQARIVVDAVRGLASHGPLIEPTTASSEEGDGATNDDTGTEEMPAGSMPNCAPDATGTRTGNAPDPDSAEYLMRVAQELEEYVDKAQVQKRVALTEKELRDRLANVRRAVAMAYPEGLPECDTVKLSLDSVESLRGTIDSANSIIMDSSTASLWVAGKPFQRGQLVSDRLGKNEKTKVVAKLQRSQEDGPPTREPAVSEDERKAMMAHYFKRQEELKKLAESEEDDYLNSSWADPKNMKRDLQGLGNVRAPGLQFPR